MNPIDRFFGGPYGILLLGATLFLLLYGAWVIAYLVARRRFGGAAWFREADQPRTFRQVVRDAYLVFDRRTLGFARIVIGFLLVTDLFRRTGTWEDMFSNEGVLPNHVNLFRSYGNFTLLNAFSTPAELWALWVVILATFVCVLVGYKTRVAHVLALVFVTSLDGRVLLIENGGYVVYNLLLLWTAFLPMGDRFSVDALLRSLRNKRERRVEELNDRRGFLEDKHYATHVSLLGLVLVLQIAAIYYFNVVHKTGPAWKDGRAVHFVLYVDRMVNPIIALVRDYPPRWMVVLLTKGTILIEGTIPLMVLAVSAVPLFKPWARRVVIACMNALHLGFGVSMVLGPFAWACCAFSTLFFTPEDWELAYRTMHRRKRARAVVLARSSPLALAFGRLAARMDNLDHLTFREEALSGTALEVERPDGTRVRRALALAEVLQALPMGPAFAWLPSLPGLRHGIDALWALADRRGTSAFFGLPPREAPEPGDGYRLPAGARLEPEEPEEPAPAPARLRARRGLAVLREFAIAAMFAGALNQALVELWVVNRRWKAPHPESLRLLSHKMRFLQGWFMFSPNPVMDDGTLIVDAVTVDGRHVNPFTGEPPDFDLLATKSYGYNQIWSDYFNRMHLPGNAGFRDAMKEYIFRYPERTGRPEDAIVRGDVYWLSDMNPRWDRLDKRRETKSYKFDRQKLFSFENPKARLREGVAPSAARSDG